MAFKIAGSMAIQEAARKANPVLLEPVMAVEVVTPEDFLGDVIGDLSRRRGKVQGQEQRGNALAVQAFVPLGEMFGYATDLRSSTQGRATYTMQFERYEEVPGEHRRGDRRAPLGRAGGCSLIDPTADAGVHLAIFPRFARRQGKVALPGSAPQNLSSQTRQNTDFER